MPTKFSNNGSSSLAGAINASANTVTVQSGDGAKFPTLAAGDTFPATLIKLVSGVEVREIVTVTAITGDIMTITRGQEGTTATTFSAGDRIENRLTAAVANGFVQGGNQANPKIRVANYIDKTTTNAAATGTVTLDCDTADIFDLTLSGATTLALANLPTLSGETFAILVRVSQGATAYALTWFSGISWLTPGGVAPAAPAANKTIEYILTTKNGTAWLGRKGAYN